VLTRLLPGLICAPESNSLSAYPLVCLKKDRRRQRVDDCPRRRFLRQHTEKSLFGPGLNRNFFLEGNEDDLVEKLIDLLEDPAKWDVMGEPPQVIDSEIIAIPSLPAFDLR